MKRHPVNIAIAEADGAIRDAEWQSRFYGEPKPGRIRAWLVDALETAIGVTLTVAGFYGFLFLAMLGG